MATSQNITTIQRKSFRFRYICENCGLQTQWYNRTIEKHISENHSIRASGDDIAFRQKAHASEWVDEVVESIKSQIESAEQLSGYFYTGMKCPKCAKPQSWFDREMYINSKIKTGCGGAALLFFILLIAGTAPIPLLMENANSLPSLPVLLLFMGLGLVPSVAFAIFFAKKQKKRIAAQKEREEKLYDEYIASLSKKNRPEVEWI
jgi:hypothetical protein